MLDFVKSGHGEWEDPEGRTRCRILWRRPEQLASDVYEWAVANGYINSVCTVYELHSGEWCGAVCVYSGGEWAKYKRCPVYFYSAPSMDTMALFISIHTHDCFILIVCHTHHFACRWWITGEDVNGMSFQGADEELLRRALGILQDQGKCTIFQGETSSEDGIKFF